MLVCELNWNVQKQGSDLNLGSFKSCTKRVIKKCKIILDNLDAPLLEDLFQLRYRVSVYDSDLYLGSRLKQYLFFVVS